MLKKYRPQDEESEEKKQFGQHPRKCGMFAGFGAPESELVDKQSDSLLDSLRALKEALTVYASTRIASPQKRGEFIYPLGGIEHIKDVLHSFEKLANTIQFEKKFLSDWTYDSTEEIRLLKDDASLEYERYVMYFRALKDTKKILEEPLDKVGSAFDAYHEVLINAASDKNTRIESHRRTFEKLELMDKIGAIAPLSSKRNKIF